MWGFEVLGMMLPAVLQTLQRSQRSPVSSCTQVPRRIDELRGPHESNLGQSLELRVRACNPAILAAANGALYGSKFTKANAARRCQRQAESETPSQCNSGSAAIAGSTGRAGS